MNEQVITKQKTSVIFLSLPGFSHSVSIAKPYLAFLHFDIRQTKQPTLLSLLPINKAAELQQRYSHQVPGRLSPVPNRGRGTVPLIIRVSEPKWGNIYWGRS